MSIASHTPSGQREHAEPINPDDLDEIDRLFFDDDEAGARIGYRPRACPIVAIISPKRGTGKTSVTVMLAGYLNTRRRRVGVLDLDPRHSVDKWRQAGKGLPFPTFVFDAKQGAARFRLAIERVSHQVDLLILDTPPSPGSPSRLALQVADLALVPAGASVLDLEAAREAIEAARNARHGRSGSLPQILLVPSRQDGRTRLARDFAQRFASLETPLAPPVGQRVEVAAAAGSGRLVRPSTAAGKEFRRLSRHVWRSLRELAGEGR